MNLCEGNTLTNTDNCDVETMKVAPTIELTESDEEDQANKADSIFQVFIFLNITRH